jgi:HAD superfamily hydrolase (TIGR01509 family)
MPDSPFAVLLDLDGTLVDSVYQHVLAWQDALRAHGHELPGWRIHAGIGMGSAKIVPWLLGRHVDESEELADEHERRFLALGDHLRPTEGAPALVDDLERRRVPFRVATSATGPIAKALLGALGRDDLPGVDAESVESPKPAPDLLLAACAQLGTDPARVTLVGDSPWDAEAAERVGLRTIAVRTGGFSDAVLRAAGAVDVVDAPGALIARL